MNALQRQLLVTVFRLLNLCFIIFLIFVYSLIRHLLSKLRLSTLLLNEYVCVCV